MRRLLRAGGNPGGRSSLDRLRAPGPRTRPARAGGPQRRGAGAGLSWAATQRSDGESTSHVEKRGRHRPHLAPQGAP